MSLTMTLGGRGARIMLRALALALIAQLTVASPAMAGPGHAGDEGHSHDAPTSASAQSPRVVALSEAFQLVGILKAGKLKIYLDREPDNMPVVDAKVTVTAGDASIEATAIADGTFEISAGDWSKPGEHEMQFTVVADGKTDLLAGVIIVPGAGKTAAGKPRDTMARIAHAASPRAVAAGLLLLGFGVVLGSLMVGRRKVMVALVGLAVAGTALTVLAHGAAAGPGHEGEEGHSHSPDVAAGLSDQASRLSDGSVFVPKPTQRLLEVRTRIAEIDSARRAVRLPGKVVAGANGPLAEVALYDQAQPEQIRTAHVIGPADTRAEVKLSGRATELRQNALIVQFALPADVSTLLRTIGQRVSVMVEVGDPVSGVILPRAAIVTSPNGQTVVFEHSEPEKFTPKPIMFAAIDPDRVVVTAGLNAGDKIVVDAASLINQVR